MEGGEERRFSDVLSLPQSVLQAVLQQATAGFLLLNRGENGVPPLLKWRECLWSIRAGLWGIYSVNLIREKAYLQAKMKWKLSKEADVKMKKADSL